MAEAFKYRRGGGGNVQETRTHEEESVRTEDAESPRQEKGSAP